MQIPTPLCAGRLWTRSPALVKGLFENADGDRVVVGTRNGRAVYISTGNTRLAVLGPGGRCAAPHLGAGPGPRVSAVHTDTRVEALVIYGLRHFREPDGQVGRHRPADPSCPCGPVPVDDPPTARLAQVGQDTPDAQRERTTR